MGLCNWDGSEIEYLNAKIVADAGLRTDKSHRRNGLTPKDNDSIVEIELDVLQRIAEINRSKDRWLDRQIDRQTDLSSGCQRGQWRMTLKNVSKIVKNTVPAFIH